MPIMPPRSNSSITSTTKRAKCLWRNQSSTDGGRRNAVWRSTSRKLLIASGPPFGANQWQDSARPRLGVDPDPLDRPRSIPVSMRTTGVWPGQALTALSSVKSPAF